MPKCFEKGKLISTFTILFFLLFTSLIVFAQESLTINTADKPPHSNQQNTGIYDRIILQVFQDMGIKVKINHLSSARSLENVEVGIDDAEYARIKGLDSTYKNIRIVNENLFNYTFTAFSKDPTIKINGWQSLANYNIAFLRGWKIYEANVKQAKSILIIPSEKELFEVLKKGRVDIILYELLRGKDYMNKNNITGVHNLSNPLSTRGMYLYVNKKHEGLIPTIEKNLRELKLTPDYQTIIDFASN